MRNPCLVPHGIYFDNESTGGWSTERSIPPAKRLKLSRNIVLRYSEYAGKQQYKGSRINSPHGQRNSFSGTPHTPLSLSTTSVDSEPLEDQWGFDYPCFHPQLHAKKSTEEKRGDRHDAWKHQCGRHPHDVYGRNTTLANTTSPSVSNRIKSTTFKENRKEKDTHKEKYTFSKGVSVAGSRGKSENRNIPFLCAKHQQEANEARKERFAPSRVKNDAVWKKQTVHVSEKTAERRPRLNIPLPVYKKGEQVQMSVRTGLRFDPVVHKTACSADTRRDPSGVSHPQSTSYVTDKRNISDNPYEDSIEVYNSLLESPSSSHLYSLSSDDASYTTYVLSNDEFHHDSLETVVSQSRSRQASGYALQKHHVPKSRANIQAKRFAKPTVSSTLKSVSRLDGHIKGHCTHNTMAMRSSVLKLNSREATLQMQAASIVKRVLNHSEPSFSTEKKHVETRLRHDSDQHHFSNSLRTQPMPNAALRNRYRNGSSLLSYRKNKGSLVNCNQPVTTPQSPSFYKYLLDIGHTTPFMGRFSSPKKILVEMKQVKTNVFKRTVLEEHFSATQVLKCGPQGVAPHASHEHSSARFEDTPPRDPQTNKVTHPVDNNEPDVPPYVSLVPRSENCVLHLASKAVQTLPQEYFNRAILDDVEGSHTNVRPKLCAEKQSDSPGILNTGCESSTAHKSFENSNISARNISCIPASLPINKASVPFGLNPPHDPQRGAKGVQGYHAPWLTVNRTACPLDEEASPEHLWLSQLREPLQYSSMSKMVSGQIIKYKRTPTSRETSTLDENIHHSTKETPFLRRYWSAPWGSSQLLHSETTDVSTMNTQLGHLGNEKCSTEDVAVIPACSRPEGSQGITCLDKPPLHGARLAGKAPPIMLSEQGALPTFSSEPSPSPVVLSGTALLYDKTRTTTSEGGPHEYVISNITPSNWDVSSTMKVPSPHYRDEGQNVKIPIIPLMTIPQSLLKTTFSQSSGEFTMLHKASPCSPVVSTYKQYECIPAQSRISEQLLRYYNYLDQPSTRQDALTNASSKQPVLSERHHLQQEQPQCPLKVKGGQVMQRDVRPPKVPSQAPQFRKLEPKQEVAKREVAPKQRGELKNVPAKQNPLLVSRVVEKVKQVLFDKKRIDNKAVLQSKSQVDSFVSGVPVKFKQGKPELPTRQPRHLSKARITQKVVEGAVRIGKNGNEETTRPEDPLRRGHVPLYSKKAQARRENVTNVPWRNHTSRTSTESVAGQVTASCAVPSDVPLSCSSVTASTPPVSLRRHDGDVHLSSPNGLPVVLVGDSPSTDIVNHGDYAPVSRMKHHSISSATDPGIAPSILPIVGNSKWTPLTVENSTTASSMDSTTQNAFPEKNSGNATGLNSLFHTLLESPVRPEVTTTPGNTQKIYTPFPQYGTPSCPSHYVYAKPVVSASNPNQFTNSHQFTNPMLYGGCYPGNSFFTSKMSGVCYAVENPSHGFTAGFPYVTQSSH